MGEWMYRSTYSWLRENSPTRYPLDGRLGEPQNRSERHGKEKILAPYRDSNSDPLAVRPVASRYTDCTIPTQTTNQLTEVINCKEHSWSWERVSPSYRQGILGLPRSPKFRYRIHKRPSLYVAWNNWPIPRHQILFLYDRLTLFPIYS
jgi:hypothetical protein